MVAIRFPACNLDGIFKFPDDATHLAYSVTSGTIGAFNDPMMATIRFLFFNFLCLDNLNRCVYFLHIHRLPLVMKPAKFCALTSLLYRCVHQVLGANVLKQWAKQDVRFLLL